MCTISIVFARWCQCTRRHCCELCKKAEPINLPFRLWTRLGQRQHKFSCICHVAPMCQRGRAHWHHVVNTIEPSICGGNVVICQTYFDRLLLAALHATQTCRYLIYSEADFEVFRPAGATRCTGGGEIWRGGGSVPSSMPNFTPTSATTRV